ncbi:PAS domain S-box protein [Verrucomicrobiota bacterium sgz303538]
MKTDQPSAAALVKKVAEALVVLDRRGRCTYVNHEAERVLGKTAEELTGRILWGVMRELARTRLPEECQRALEDQRPRSFEEHDKQRGGWWERRLLPAPDGLSLYFADVTERKIREEDLRLSERSYSDLLRSLGGIVWVADARTLQFLYVSEQGARILGYPVKQWLEEPEFWRNHVHPDDRERCISLRLDALAMGQDTAFEYRMFAADGREVWLHEFVFPHLDVSGELRLHGIMLEAEKKTRGGFEYDGLWHDLEERVKEFSTLAGAAYLLQRSERSLEENLRELASLLPQSFQFPESAAACITLGEMQVATPEFRAVSPLYAECRAASGTLCRVEVAYLEDRPRAKIGPFLEEEQLLLHSIVDLLRLSEDRRQAHEALQEREEHFRTLVHSSADCMAMIAEDGAILYQSPTIERMVGFSPEELIGHRVTEFIRPADVPNWAAFLRETFSKGDVSARLEYHWRSRDGSWRVLESTGRRIVDEHGCPAAVISTRDVSDRSEIERQLRESEERFRRLFEKNAAGMVICDADYRIWQANPAFCRMLGYSEEELVRLSVIDITHPDDRAETIHVSEEMRAGLQAIELEKRYLRKDGGTVWARMGSIAYTTDRTSACCIATVQDITAIKVASDALRVSKERYHSLLLASAQVIWIMDARGESLIDSPSWYELTGLTEEECRNGGWLKAIHPDDRARVDQLWSDAVDRKVIYQTETRIRTAHGECRDFAVRGAPVWNGAGSVREWVGTCTDITDGKRAKIDLLTWKNRYDAAVIASRQLLYDWDMTGDAVNYGGSPEAIIGYTLEEMKEVGGVRRWTELVHPDDRKAFCEHVDRVRRTHGSFHFKYRLRHKDGSYRFVQDHGQCYREEWSDAYRMTGFVSDVTEYVELEQRLRASEERFRRIFEECGVGMIVTDLDQRFLQVNPAYCRFLGYSAEELRTMTQRDLVYPDDLPAYDRNFQEVLSGRRRVLDMDKRCVRKDGRVVWAHLTGVFPLARGRPAYCVAVIQDLTARKQAEEEVSRKDRFYRSLIENSSDNITVLDEYGITLFQSPAIERQIGYKPEELVGKNNVELIHVDDRKKATRRLIETLRRGETSVPQILRFRCKDGSWRILETVGKRYIGDSGHTVGIFNTRDVTDRVIAGELLERAKRQAEAANIAKDRFLAALSHELRTPLTPVVALLPALLQAPDLPGHMRSDLVMIKQNVDLETRLIDDLLDLTRITQDKVSLNRQKVDAHELIRATLEIVRSDANAKQIGLDLDLQSREHHIWADRVRMQQVLWNLLKNAIKFSPARSRIAVTSSNPEPGRIRITVRDQGAGIEQEQLRHIFDAFVQTLTGGGHQFGGLGLGLFISRAMVERHAGTIDVESEGLGKGAAFHVTLATVPEGAMPEIAAPEPTQVTRIAPLRILLVEDHDHTREVLSRLLQRQGHTVLVAQSVQEAIDVASENQVDVVVSDLGLPDGSGFDLMPQLKSRYGVKGIAVSGYGMEQDLKRSREAGFDAHLVKPVDFKQLIAALQAVTSAPKNAH